MRYDVHRGKVRDGSEDRRGVEDSGRKFFWGFFFRRRRRLRGMMSFIDSRGFFFSLSLFFFFSLSPPLSPSQNAKQRKR